MNAKSDMKEKRSRLVALSRRTWLGAAAVLTGAAATVMVPRAALAKSSKAEAKYQDQPKGKSAMCGVCKYYQPPTNCQLVEGPISPAGWCPLFEKKA